MLHCLNLKHYDRPEVQAENCPSELQVLEPVANRICAACSKRRESNKNDNFFELYDVEAIMGYFDNF